MGLKTKYCWRSDFIAYLEPFFNNLCVECNLHFFGRNVSFWNIGVNGVRKKQSDVSKVVKEKQSTVKEKQSYWSSHTGVRKLKSNSHTGVRKLKIISHTGVRKKRNSHTGVRKLKTISHTGVVILE